MSMTKKPSKKSSSATTGTSSPSKTKPRKPKKNQARQSSKPKRARANKNKKEYTVASTTYSQRSGKNSSSATTGNSSRSNKKELTAASISNSQRSVNTTTQASKTSSSATTGNSSRSKFEPRKKPTRQSSTPKRARVSTVPNELKSVEQIKEMLRNKGLNLHRDCSNFDPEKGTTTMEGSVKCGAILKANPNIMLLYKKPNAVAGLVITKENMRSEISDYRHMREAGLPLPEIYSDVFDCKVNGTSTFGFLVEVVHTSMRAPYKPGAHKVTIKNIRSSFANLTADQLRVALNDIKRIGEYTRKKHFVHDLQLLCQDRGPKNGRIFVIDPGELQNPNGTNQMRMLLGVVTKLLKSKTAQHPNTSTPPEKKCKK
eukprot:g1644.t1